jgi:hypothetical protein
MRRAYLLGALALSLLLLASSTVATAKASSPFDPPVGDEWSREAMDLAQKFGMFGPISFEDGVLRGAFVEATVADGPGNLVSFSLVRQGTSTEVFASVEVEGALGIGGVWSLAPGGLPALFFTGGDVSVRIHNNPSRALIYRSVGQELEISFFAAPGIVFALQDGSVLVAGRGFEGLIAPHGSVLISLQQGVVRVVLSPGSAVSFRAQPGEDEGVVGPWAQDAVFTALARQRLGAELFLVALEGEVLDDAVIYTDISVESTLGADGRLTVTVSRESSVAVATRTIIVINMHRDVLSITDVDRISVDLDGSPVERTSVVDELPVTLAASAKFYAAVGTNGTFLMVYLPQLSTRILTIGEMVETFLRELTPTVIAYILLGVVVTAVAAAALFRRGREGW